LGHGQRKAAVIGKADLEKDAVKFRHRLSVSPEKRLFTNQNVSPPKGPGPPDRQRIFYDSSRGPFRRAVDYDEGYPLTTTGRPISLPPSMKF
jgi:hypothetical protein